MAGTVKEQYETLPYPPREAYLEKERLLETVGDNLLEINHYCFEGKRDFSQGINCLVAGGGTGDAVIFLAEQLRETPSVVTYIDLSAASRKVAESRARERSLSNIRWYTGSILDLPKLFTEKFDYINCSGVLHHLKRPEDGLACLRAVLSNDGAINLMLYAKYGRHGVYIVQKLMNELMPRELPIPERLKWAKNILKVLPETNEFNLRGHRTAEIDQDSGLYDLLLHSQDRSYDVAEIYALAQSSNLNVVEFIGPQKKSYKPELTIANEDINSLLRSKSRIQREAIGERLACNISKHHVVLSTMEKSKAAISDESLAIKLAFEMANKNLELSNAITVGEELRITHTVEGSNKAFVIPGNEISKELCRFLDGVTPTGSIISQVAARQGIERTAVRSELFRLFEILSSNDWAFLTR